eukprot:6180349-Pleurochrysis_carterae.AAC.1
MESQVGRGFHFHFPAAPRAQERRASSFAQRERETKAVLRRALYDDVATQRGSSARANSPEPTPSESGSPSRGRECSRPLARELGAGSDELPRRASPRVMKATRARDRRDHRSSQSILRLQMSCWWLAQWFGRSVIGSVAWHADSTMWKYVDWRAALLMTTALFKC